MSYRIPFNRPSFEGREHLYLEQALDNGWIAGDGAFTRRCQEILERELGVPRALLTTSCTHALELAALLLDVGPGDEVVVPSFTFVSTANAFALRGARIVFCDIRADTLNLDETALESLVTDRTRAVVVVHYAGVGCEMEVIGDLASRHRFDVVEDNAHGLLGSYRGRPLGTFGRLATLSFHETKNFSCGEGGALLINDPSLVERAEIMREKGTNRSQFFRGQVDKYTWVETGSSYLPSDLLAAVLCAQLEAGERIQGRRRRIWERYHEGLRGWAEENGVSLPFIPGHCAQPYHMFYLLMPDLERRGRLIRHLQQRGILAVFHYVPLHSSPMGRELGGEPGQCPVAENISDRLLRLPFYNSLTAEDHDRVIEAVREFTA
jgi:dTDP-4-amino-4,6-dideoxygalactose transaminase